MKTLIAMLLVSMVGVSAWNPQALGVRPGAGDDPLCDAGEQPAITFAAINITIDPLGKPLGAYQFELSAVDAPFTVVGVEAGEHPAFDHGRPPYFDRLTQEFDTDRLIVAEYALPKLAADQLPTDAVRIATVHVMFTQPVDADALPELRLKLVTAGDATGKKINATLSHTLQIPERHE